MKLLNIAACCSAFVSLWKNKAGVNMNRGIESVISICLFTVMRNPDVAGILLTISTQHITPHVGKSNTSTVIGVGFTVCAKISRSTTDLFISYVGEAMNGQEALSRNIYWIPSKVYDFIVCIVGISFNRSYDSLAKLNAALGCANVQDCIRNSIVCKCSRSDDSVGCCLCLQWMLFVFTVQVIHAITDCRLRIHSCKLNHQQCRIRCPCPDIVQGHLLCFCFGVDG